MAKKKKHKSLKKRSRQKKSRSKVNKKMLWAIGILFMAGLSVGGVGWYLLAHKAESNVKAGDVKFESGEYKKAHKLYGKAVRKEPTNLEYVEKLRKALLNMVPVTPDSARSTYDQFIGTLTHEARYNPLDIEAHLAVAQELFDAGWLTGRESFWRQLRAVTQIGLDRVSLDNPRRYELLLFRALASLHIEDDSMTETYDTQGNLRFPGEDDLEEVLEKDPGNAMAWAALTHGRMALYYRLLDSGKTKQARRNKIFAHETLDRASEVAGDSFEVSAIVLRELILQRTTLLQKQLLDPESVLEEDGNSINDKINEARDMVVNAYDPEVNYPRANEVATLMLVTGEGGREYAEAVLLDTIGVHENDFARKYFLATIQFELGKFDEASKVANEILNSELQTVGLHAIELYAYRPPIANFLVLMNTSESLKAEDEEEKKAYIKEAKQYREKLFDLVSGNETNQYLLYSDGSIALAEERYGDAATLFDEAISRYPDSEVIIYKQSAYALEKINSIGLAIDRYQYIVEKEPSNVDAFLSKALLELRITRTEAAAVTLSNLPEEALSSEKAQEILNLLALQRSNDSGSEISDANLRFILQSEQLSAGGKHDEAILLLTNAVDLSSEPDLRLFLAISRVYADKDDKDQAVVWMNKAIELSPDPDKLLPRLFILESDNRVEALIKYAESKDESEEVITENIAFSLYELGLELQRESNRWEQQGNSVKAEEVAELSKLSLQKSEQYQARVESLGADMSRILGIRFNEELDKGKFEKAEALLDKMKELSVDQNSINGFQVSLHTARAKEAKNYGNLDVFKIEMESALAIANAMVKEFGVSDHPWRILGHVQFEYGNLPEAKDAFAEAYRISPRRKENIRRYVGALAALGSEHQRILRVLRIAKEQHPNDQQLFSAWLEAELQHGESWRVLAYRQNTHSLHPDNRMNALELALMLSEGEPSMNVLRNSEGELLYSPQTWQKMPFSQREMILRDARKEWNLLILQILEDASKSVDSSTKQALIHASIHRNLGQLEQSSDILDRYIDSLTDDKRYVGAVLSAAEFLSNSVRSQQALKLLEDARVKQSDLHEVDYALGVMYYNAGEYGSAAEYMEQVVNATGQSNVRARLIESLALDGQFEEAERALVEYKTTNTEYAEAMLRALISRVQSEQLLAQGDVVAGTAMLKKYRDSLRAGIEADTSNSTPYIGLCRSLLSEYELTQNKSLLQEALLVADEAAFINKKTGQHVIVRADVLQADGQLDRAIEHLSRYLSESPDSNNVRTRLIEAYIDSNDSSKALGVAQGGVELNPSDSMWHERLGDLHIRTNDDRNEGVKAYLRAIGITPDSRLLMKIDEVTRTNQELPNQELLEIVVDKLSTLHPIAGAIEAKALNNLGRNRDALLAMKRSWRMFEEGIRKGWLPPGIASRWFLDLQHIYKDDPAGGEAFVRSLVNGALSQEQLANLAGYYKAFGGEYIGQAIQIIDSALALPSEDKDVRIRLLTMKGGFLVLINEYLKSEETFRLLAEEYDSPMVQNNLAYVIGVYQNRPEEGLKIALEAVKKMPRNPSVIDTVSMMYQRMGEYKKAAETLDYLLQVDPVDTTAMSKLALLYADHLDQAERGVVVATRARSQKSHSPEVLDALGWSYYRTGKKELAEETIRRSLRYGDTMEAYLHLSQIVTEDEKYDEALGHLRMAQELAEDEFSLNSILALKDDIRKKKTEANK
ncbi:MAG: tetratricopeptide repeat protein [Planctomycetes bacterium]|nr:tetratricopeptide repeat protein [Planctomycetota bacterium]